MGDRIAFTPMMRKTLLVGLLLLPAVTWAGDEETISWIVTGLQVMAQLGPRPPDPACAEAQRLCQEYQLTSEQLGQLKKILRMAQRDATCLDVCNTEEATACDAAASVAGDALARATRGDLSKADEAFDTVEAVMQRDAVSRECQEKRLLPILKGYVAARGRRHD